MLFSEKFLDATREEIEFLKSKIRQLESILAEGGSPQSIPVVSRMVKSTSAPLVDKGGFGGMIRHILSESSKGLSSTEITELLQQRGLQLNGKTSIGVRVSTELYRMKKRGAIRKTRRGYMLTADVLN